MKRSTFSQGLMALAVAVITLSACTTPPKQPAEPGVSDPTKGGKPPKRKPPTPQKRGGGYYKDDGPAEEIPEGLDELADAEPRIEPLHRFANRPYVVFGKEYVPATSLKPYKERGIGSWYGKKFHGQKTSIGEPYDMFAMTAAHPTLPLPSYARVTNLGNGKSVIVRVIDRGPFHAGRVIDLSYAAAYRLDYVSKGSTQVEVEAILPEANGTINIAQSSPPPVASTPPPAPPQQQQQRDEIAEIALLASKLHADEAPVRPATSIGLNGGSANPLAPGSVLLQLGAFANAENAEIMRQRMLRELDWTEAELRINSNDGIHRVHLGPFRNRAAAEKVAERIRQDYGFKPTLVTR